MKLITGLFFDLDGTLTDNYEAQLHSYKSAAEAVGRKFDEAAYRPLHGMSYRLFLPRLYPDITHEEMEELAKIKADKLVENLHRIRPNSELIGFLKPFKKSHTLVLVTSSKEISARRMLKVLELDDIFHHLIFGDMVKNPKPDPEAYLKALALSGLEADEVLAFEDSPHGIEAALAAGIRTLRITL